METDRNNTIWIEIDPIRNMEIPIQSSLQVAAERVVSLRYMLRDQDAVAWKAECSKKVRIEIQLSEWFVSLAIDGLIIGDLGSDVGDFRRRQADIKPVKLLVLDGILANWLEVEGDRPIQKIYKSGRVKGCLGSPVNEKCNVADSYVEPAKLPMILEKKIDLVKVVLNGLWESSYGYDKPRGGRSRRNSD